MPRLLLQILSEAHASARHFQKTYYLQSYKFDQLYEIIKNDINTGISTVFRFTSV